MICDAKYNFSLVQKIFFVVSSKVSIFHQIQPKHKLQEFLKYTSVPRVKGQIGEEKKFAFLHDTDQVLKWKKIKEKQNINPRFECYPLVGNFPLF